MHKTYLKSSHSSTLTLANIDEGYVASLIDRLKNKESSGIDKLSNKHIKAAKNVIAKSLTLMINQMLNTGIFPVILKQSKVTPIYKANDNELLSNYRPISVIDNNLFSLNQYGFRAQDSTELTALNIVDRFTYLMDQGIIPLNIYIDLS